MVEIIHLLFEPMMVDREFDPAEYDTVAKAAKVGEIALRESACTNRPRTACF